MPAPETSIYLVAVIAFGSFPAAVIAAVIAHINPSRSTTTKMFFENLSALLIFIGIVCLLAYAILASMLGR